MFTLLVVICFVLFLCIRFIVVFLLVFFPFVLQKTRKIEINVPFLQSSKIYLISELSRPFDGKMVQLLMVNKVLIFGLTKLSFHKIIRAGLFNCQSNDNLLTKNQKKKKDFI